MVANTNSKDQLKNIICHCTVHVDNCRTITGNRTHWKKVTRQGVASLEADRITAMKEKRHAASKRLERVCTSPQRAPWPVPSVAKSAEYPSVYSAIHSWQLQLGLFQSSLTSMDCWRRLGTHECLCQHAVVPVIWWWPLMAGKVTSELVSQWHALQALVIYHLWAQGLTARRVEHPTFTPLKWHTLRSPLLAARAIYWYQMNQPPASRSCQRWSFYGQDAHSCGMYM